MEVHNDDATVISRILNHVKEPLQSSFIFKLDEIMFLELKYKEKRQCETRVTCSVIKYKSIVDREIKSYAR